MSRPARQVVAANQRKCRNGPVAIRWDCSWSRTTCLLSLLTCSRWLQDTPAAACEHYMQPALNRVGNDGEKVLHIAGSLTLRCRWAVHQER